MHCSRKCLSSSSSWPQMNRLDELLAMGLPSLCHKVNPFEIDIVLRTLRIWIPINSLAQFTDEIPSQS